ncbi:Translin-1 [Entomophthora muscae]|uniref:Translin-1 n=1 Tax=Entomophthora muscae TaxID=34485 RepID=A0ACC2UFG4_9FUNG|nr:Translin-1 [Entomophthora muscae]
MLDLMIFDQIQAKLDLDAQEQEAIKDVTKELDRFIRTVRSTLNIVYTAPKEEIQNIIARANENMKQVKTQLAKLSELVPENKFYKYQHVWNSSTQQICSIIALMIFLSENRLATIQDIPNFTDMPFLLDQDISGESKDPKTPASAFHFTLDDYLHGLINLSNEIPRLAITSVIQHQDYNRPSELGQFLSELNTGFQLLNLKNDSLRRRFDSLKYDIKKVEEIIYDLAIRGLSK